MRIKKKFDKIVPYLMVTPAMAVLGIFVLYPIGYLFYLSGYNYNLLNHEKSVFVGFDNFIQVLSRQDFLKAILNTTVYTVSVVVVTITLGLLAAMWLNNSLNKINRIMQVGIFTPHIVSVVSISLIWLWMMDPAMGFFNYVFKTLGLPTSQFLQSSSTAMASIIVVSIWKHVGYYALILLAALRCISSDIYEAAALDNANRLKVFFKITLPMISPQLFFCLIILTIDCFKMFDMVQVMSDGGPNKATTTLVYFIYQFRSTRVGYSAVAGIILVIIVGLLTIFYFKRLSSKVHYQ